MIKTNLPSNDLSGSTDLRNLVDIIGARIDKLHMTAVDEFGQNGTYVLLLFVLFILLILLIYIKSVVDTFKTSGNSSDASGIFYTQTSGGGNAGADNELISFEDENNEDLRPRIMPKDENFIAQRLAAELEKEKEISRDLLISSAEDAQIAQHLRRRLKDQVVHNYNSRLDWEKYNEMTKEELSRETSLHYKPEPQSLEEMVGLVINMLGREVSPPKMAQAIYSRTQGNSSEEDVLQLISTIRDFIALCNAHKFNDIPQRDSLPRTNEALYNWAKGDNSQCLSLMENLIKYQIDKAETLEGLVKEMAYAQAASYACIFGTIAKTDNIELARNSYELALELAPKNINAWSRCADIYWQEGNYERAVYAYQTVVENGDDDLYASQKANANHHLAIYFSENGNINTANNLEKSSQQFYNNFGINTALSDKEKDALDLIISNHHQTLQSSIYKLMQSQQQYV